MLLFTCIGSSSSCESFRDPASVYSQERLRAVSKRADETAQRIVNRRCAGATRPAWIATLEAAKRWELQAFTTAVQIAEAYLCSACAGASMMAVLTFWASRASLVASTTNT